MNEIKRLKANGCHVKIIFGYKNGNKNVNGPDEIANELMKRDSLGYAKPEEVKEIGITSKSDLQSEYNEMIQKIYVPIY